ncbi:MAG: hypothetical protein GEV03_11635 [Streptosporangiales bacterium]|nr:hypothetical protein [Streptosporangiales bacterium]
MNEPITRRSRWTVRVAPAIGLYFLAPLVAEFLMGNVPITHLYALLALAPLYGGGALLIREIARRTGRGWPTMLTWALAYGMFEEALVTQTLWNPNWGNTRILDYGFVPELGTAPPWMMFMVGVHTVFSISVPIAIVETLAGPRRTTPWLGKVGLGVTTALFVVIVGFSIFGTIWAIGNFASAPQLVGAGVVIVVIVALGWRFGRPAPLAGARPQAAGNAPSPWFVGGFALVAGATFVLLYATDPRGLSPWLAAAIPIPAWLSVVIYLALFAVVLTLMARWSHRAGWSDAHRLALAGGALLTYAWHSFPWQSIAPASPAVDLAGNTLFTAGAVALLVVTALRLRRDGRSYE